MRPLNFAFVQNQNTPIPDVGPQTSYPIADGSGTWSIENGTGDLWEQIDDVAADDSTTNIWSPLTTNEETQDITMQSLQEPDVHDETVIYVRYARRGSPTAGQYFRLYLDGVLISFKALQHDNDWHDWTINLTEAQSEAINWGAQMTVTLNKQPSTYTRGVRVSALRIMTEQ
jgi:hypothetical protein